MIRIVKNSFSAIVLLVLLVASCSHAQQGRAELGPNLLKNGGFEEGVKYWSFPKGASQIVEDKARSGKASFHYVNTRPDQYNLFRQKINLEGGKQYLLSAWVMGENIKGSGTYAAESGAGVYVEFTGPAGFMGGRYAKRVNGTFGWKQISTIVGVPTDATSMVLGIYLDKKTTGSVWYDDVEIREISEPLPPPIQSHLLYPNYRGMIEQGDATPISYRIQVDHQRYWPDNPVQVINTLKNGHSKVLLEAKNEIPSTGVSTINLQLPRDLPVGSYLLEETIIDPNNKITGHQAYPVQVVEKLPQVHQDAEGFTVVDGKRFFPLGIYLHNADTAEEHLARISQGGFNTVLAYSSADPDAYLDRAQKHNLKVIYPLHTLYPEFTGKADATSEAARVIKEVQHKPALLAWYTNDERWWPASFLKMYNLIKEHDTRPAFNLAAGGGMKQFTDIFASDPYPVGRTADLNWTSNVAKANGTKAKNGQAPKSFWMVLQTFDWAVYTNSTNKNQRPPTLDEMRTQSYLSLIHGATGLMYYSYYDMRYAKYPRGAKTQDNELFERRWKDVSAMMTELNGIIPSLLKSKKVAVDSVAESDVQVGAWQDADQLFLILANPRRQQKSVTVTLPDGWTIKDAEQGAIKSTFANGKATFTLPPVGSGVFHLAKS